jgi:hypothetical protein
VSDISGVKTMALFFSQRWFAISFCSEKILFLLQLVVEITTASKNKKILILFI